MKRMAFRGFKAKMIMNGDKTASIRLFDDKDLQIGDELELIDSDNNTVFAKASIIDIVNKQLGQIVDSDLTGHEKWKSNEDMIKTLKTYYGDKISKKTNAKIVRFNLK